MTFGKVAPWIVAVVASVLAVGVLVWALNRGRTSARELARVNEERRLEAVGLNVAHQVASDALMQDLMGEATASAALAEELARIQAAAPGAKPIASAHGSTPWKPVGPAASVSAPPHPSASGADAPAPPVPASTCPPCRLWVGDEVRVRAGGAALETKAGNYVVGAVASVWRRPAGDAGEGEKLHEEKLDLEVKVPVQGAGPGWGVGVVVVGGRSGYWLGPLFSPPPIRLWGMEASLLLGAGVGGGGEWGGLGGGLLRW